MKRLISLAMALAVTMLLMLSVSGSGGRRVVTVVLNGETVTFDTPAYIENNRTMVPLRAVAEALGLEVTWDQTSATAWLSDGSWTPSLQGRTIVVDPGHGGSSTGAFYGGTAESRLNLAIAQALAEELRALGASVVMTRKTDVDVSPADRAAMANRLKADLFLSVHCNVSLTNSSARGVYTAYHGGSAQSRRAAELLKNAMVSAAGVPDMGAHDRSDLAVLRQTKMPAALLECGFMSTPEELEQLRRPEHQRALAQGAAYGAALFLSAAS